MKNERYSIEDMLVSLSLQCSVTNLIFCKCAFVFLFLFKSLVLAMTLHEQGKRMLQRRKFTDALLLLLSADEEFRLVFSRLVRAVGKFSILVTFFHEISQSFGRQYRVFRLVQQQTICLFLFHPLRSSPREVVVISKPLRVNFRKL